MFFQFASSSGAAATSSLTANSIQGVFGEMTYVIDPAATLNTNSMQGVYGEMQPVISGE